ncbi:MAG: glycosyltransferase family 2 protein [Flavobacterium sp.]|nr:glycosyltransferase family 2 protein [Flavobacterium sp.]
MKKISLVIPVYNNEGSLKELHTRIISSIKAYNSNFLYEFIFINDGSKDKSFDILIDLKNNDRDVTVINFSRNFGQLAGILAGWKHASGDAVITMSADLQDPPEQITTMLKEWENNYEIVVNYREARQDAFFASITSRIAYKLFRYSIPNLPAGGFDYALVGRQAMDAINSFTEKYRFPQGDILWVGFNVKYLPYTRLEREHGKSGFTFLRRFGDFMAIFFSISYFPIRLMSLIGFITALTGFIYAISILYAFLAHRTPFEGWAPIMMAILLVGGLLMIMLGIIGEYIWRIYDEIKHRPDYIIKEVIKSE